MEGIVIQVRKSYQYGDSAEVSLTESVVAALVRQNLDAPAAAVFDAIMPQLKAVVLDVIEQIIAEPEPKPEAEEE